MHDRSDATFDVCYRQLPLTSYTRWQIVEQIENAGFEPLDPYLPEPIVDACTVVYAVAPVDAGTKFRLAKCLRRQYKYLRDFSCREIWRHPVVHVGPIFKVPTMFPSNYELYIYLRNQIMHSYVYGIVSEYQRNELVFTRIPNSVDIMRNWIVLKLNRCRLD